MGLLDGLLGMQGPLSGLLSGGGGAPQPDERVKALLAQGMTPEQAQQAIAHMDAMRAAAQRPYEPPTTKPRFAAPTIGVRG